MRVLFCCILFLVVVVVVSLQIFLLVLVSFFENEPAISCNTDRERWPFFRKSQRNSKRKKRLSSHSRSKIPPSKELGKEKKERFGKGRIKKAMVALLVFILVALKTVYGPKTLYDTWKRSKIRLDMPYSKVVTKIRPTHFRHFFTQFPETL